MRFADRGTQMRKIMVTGGAGFIGSAVCRHLVQVSKQQVLNLDKLTYAAVPGSLCGVEDHPLYRFEQADVCDQEKTASLLEDFQPDAVMHLAAESHVDRSIDGPAAFMQTNIMGTYTVLECARSYWENLPAGRRAAFRFLHVSTDEVYGSLGRTGAFKETSAYNPRSPYSASKAAGDHLVMAWHHTYGLPVIVTNSSNNYGPYQHPEKLIPRMIISALLGKNLPVYGNGKNVRDWIHVDDHAEALVRLLETGTPGETYNIGAGNERTNLEVVETICQMLDELRPLFGGAGSICQSRLELIRFVKDRPGHDFRYALDTSKIASELHWRARKKWNEGLRDTVCWYLEHEPWWRGN